MAEAGQKERREARVLVHIKALANGCINSLLRTGEGTRAALKRPPTIRAAVSGAIVTTAALVVGVIPTAIGCTAGYVSYRLFREQQRQQAEELRK